MNKLFTILFVSLMGFLFVGCPYYPGGGGDGGGGFYSNSITVYNDSGDRIGGIFISPCSDSFWGPNQLDYVLYPGESINFTNVSSGCWDILAESYEDSGYWDSYGVSLSGGENYSFSLYDKKVDEKDGVERKISSSGGLISSLTKLCE